MPVPRPRLAALLLAAAAPSVAPAADTAGSVDIGGGRKMYVECRGAGAPAVVIVAGGKAVGGRLDRGRVARRAERLRRDRRLHRVCAYDRPGTPVGEAPSRSDPAPQPTNGGRRGRRPPRAARRRRHRHAGGARRRIPTAALVVRLYARTYPDDVAGMVLVDALSEGLREAETPGGVGDPARPPGRGPDRDAEALSRDRAARRRPQLRPAPRRPAAAADAARRAQRRPPVGAAGARLHRRRHAAARHAPGRRLRHRPRRRRWRRPSSPPASRARGTSRTPTAATRSTRTSRSSSSTRSATSSTPCVPAGPSWRPDAPARFRDAPATTPTIGVPAGGCLGLPGRRALGRSSCFLTVLPLRPAYGQVTPAGRRRCAGSASTSRISTISTWPATPLAPSCGYGACVPRPTWRRSARSPFRRPRRA